MRTLTRRRDPDARHESWLTYYGDVHVGSIGLRSGNPVDSDPWQWLCGFYPESRPGECTSGTKETFLAITDAFASFDSGSCFDRVRDRHVSRDGR